MTNRRSLNLIPPATQRRIALRRLTRTWSTAVLFCSFAAACLLGLEWTRAVFAARELGRLETRYEPLVTLTKENSSLASRITELRAREQLSLRLSHKEHGLSALAAVTAAARDGEGDVYLTRLDYAGLAADSTAKKKREERSVELAGAGVDSVAVASFVQRLRAVGLFESVAVESTEPMAGGDERLRQFRMRCKL